jgi:hypothetical protein
MFRPRGVTRNFSNHGVTSGDAVGKVVGADDEEEGCIQETPLRILKWGGGSLATEGGGATFPLLGCTNMYVVQREGVE